MVWLPNGGTILKICLFISTEFMNVTAHTDGHCMTAKAMLAQHRAAKTQECNTISKHIGLPYYFYKILDLKIFKK